MKNLALYSIIILFFSLNVQYSIGQEKNSENSLKMLFIGDIMGHDTQLIAAYDSVTRTYNFDSVFAPLKATIENADFSVANLEVTLAGPPHKGYPQFSSPDELALSCKKNGMDILVTANNHSCDRGKNGIIRTVDVLDSLGIQHTGTFRDKADKDTMNLMVLEKSGIKVVLLNYTYGTNNIPFPPPVLVNLIDRDSMLADLNAAKSLKPDKVIVMIHWGKEYEILSDDFQRKTAEFLLSNGADIIIGSHPHVIQPMEYHKADKKNKERLIVYSLGNFVSNQREFRTDGGAMVEFTLVKEKNEVSIKNQGYYLTWVNKEEKDKKARFEILHCSALEEAGFPGLNKVAREKAEEFIRDSRERLAKENVNFPEIKVPASL